MPASNTEQAGGDPFWPPCQYPCHQVTRSRQGVTHLGPPLYRHLFRSLPVSFPSPGHDATPVLDTCLARVRAVTLFFGRGIWQVVSCGGGLSVAVGAACRSRFWSLQPRLWKVFRTVIVAPSFSIGISARILPLARTRCRAGSRHVSCPRSRIKIVVRQGAEYIPCTFVSHVASAAHVHEVEEAFVTPREVYLLTGLRCGHVCLPPHGVFRLW